LSSLVPRERGAPATASINENSFGNRCPVSAEMKINGA
jgi:hypothetical protein